MESTRRQPDIVASFRGLNQDATRKPYRAILQQDGTYLLQDKKVVFQNNYWRYLDPQGKTVSPYEFRPLNAFRNYEFETPPDRSYLAPEDGRLGLRTLRDPETERESKIQYHKNLDLWIYQRTKETDPLKPLGEDQWQGDNWKPGTQTYRYAKRVWDQSVVVGTTQPQDTGPIATGSADRSASLSTQSTERDDTPPDQTHTPSNSGEQPPGPPSEPSGSNPNPFPPPPPPDRPPSPPHGPSASSPNMSTGKAEVARPEAYDGNPDTVSVYTVHCELVFALNGSIYDTDRKKKAYLLSFCTKDLAAAWAEEAIGQWMKETSTTPAFTALTWDQAKHEFQSKFLPSDLVAEALMKLKTIRQGDEFEKFLAEFKKYQTRSGHTSVTHIRQDFLNALKPGLKAKLLSVRSDNVDTIAKLYEEARKFEMQYLIDTAGSRGRSEGSSQKGQTNWRQKGQGRKGVRVKALSAEEMDRHFKEELCFNCHKKGHKSAECRQKKIREIETAIEDPKVPSAEVKKLVTSIDRHEFLPEEKDLLDEGF
ncbi:hypothetical protein QCA50_018325 [Cerrena zonata]|uniref:CCHC-type domain-containing protein n=1 Tax=Cerrena zonata TaxID=2478898 RepID=A0AAW0FBF0_9APHY